MTGETTPGEWTDSGVLASYTGNRCPLWIGVDYQCWRLQNAGEYMYQTIATPTTGYQNIRLQWNVKPRDTDGSTSEGCSVYYNVDNSGNSNWILIETKIGGTNINATSYLNTGLSSDNNDGGIRIKIEVLGVDGNEKCYMDNFYLLGDVITSTPTNNPITNIPTTSTPTTSIPTNMPTTNVPTTNAPTTDAPTDAPTTTTPTTTAPTTYEPSNAPTDAPITNEPTLNPSKPPLEFVETSQPTSDTIYITQKPETTHIKSTIIIIEETIKRTKEVIIDAGNDNNGVAESNILIEMLNGDLLFLLIGVLCIFIGYFCCILICYIKYSQRYTNELSERVTQSISKQLSINHQIDMTKLKSISSRISATGRVIAGPSATKSPSNHNNTEKEIELIQVRTSQPPKRNKKKKKKKKKRNETFDEKETEYAESSRSSETSETSSGTEGSGGTSDTGDTSDTTSNTGNSDDDVIDGERYIDNDGFIHDGHTTNINMNPMDTNALPLHLMYANNPQINNYKAISGGDKGGGGGVGYSTNDIPWQLVQNSFPQSYPPEMLQNVNSFVDQQKLFQQQYINNNNNDNNVSQTQLTSYPDIPMSEIHQSALDLHQQSQLKNNNNNNNNNPQINVINEHQQSQQINIQNINRGNLSNLKHERHGTATTLSALKINGNLAPPVAESVLSCLSELTSEISSIANSSENSSENSSDNESDSNSDSNSNSQSESESDDDDDDDDKTELQTIISEQQETEFTEQTDNNNDNDDNVDHLELDSSFLALQNNTSKLNFHE